MLYIAVEDVDYEQVKANKIINSTLLGIITMDASRCYQGREDMPRETLVEILSSYASYAPYVGYC